MSQDKLLLKNVNATIISNKMAFDKNFTAEEKGVYYLISCLPENWSLSIKGISTLSGLGKNKTSDILKKFRDHGYLYCKKNTDGTFTTTVNMVNKDSNANKDIEVSAEQLQEKIDSVEVGENISSQETQNDNKDNSFNETISDSNIEENIILENNDIVENVTKDSKEVAEDTNKESKPEVKENKANKPEVKLENFDLTKEAPKQIVNNIENVEDNEIGVGTGENKPLPDTNEIEKTTIEKKIEVPDIESSSKAEVNSTFAKLLGK